MTFRSIQMAHFRLFLPRENFYHSVEELLSLGNSHIIDIGSPLNRPFFNQLKRIDDLLNKVHTLTQALKQKSISFEQYDQTEPNFMASLQMLWRKQAQKLGKQDSKLIDHYDTEISEQWQRYIDKRNSLERLKSNQKAVLSKIACFEALNTFFGEGRLVGQLAIGGSNGISAMVGVVEPSLELKLSRTIYRISRGFAYFKTIDNFAFQGLRNFPDQVVILIYPNSSSGVLQKKLTRVMQTFTTTLIQFREGQKATEYMKNCRRQFQQANNLIDLNEKQLNKFLDSTRNRHSIETWRIFLWKQHLIYDTLNKMLLKDHFLVADVYLPRSEKAKLQLRISTISPPPQVQELPVIKPPTAFDTNCYTTISQQITDTYGVPRYQQMNPAIFTTVTFPFFFGVMFGDMGHGLVLFLFGLYLVFNNEVLKKTSFGFLSSLRYMVLMMGFFAFYCGWIYNDFLGMNLNIFGSCYDPTKALEDKDNYLEPHPDCIYPFGIDPIWGKAGNQLVFVNSLKMKIAVIIAIVHMSVGVVIKYFNASFFKRKLQMFFQFIPQILFLGLLFGYMDFLIIYKWLTNWGCVVRTDPITGAQGIACNENHMPPSIISTMMDIGLKLGSTLDSKAMWGEAGNSSQDTIQVIILLIAVLSVPIMLFPKPCIEIKKHKKVHKDYPLLAEQLQHQRQNKVNESQESSNYEKPQKQNYFNQPQAKQQEHDSSEIFVHQLIETIEFVLGAISNTASYLRLWALSLAHSQLAKVFFQKTLQYGFTGNAYLGLVAMPVLFYILIWVTFAVLMCMDTMQCFLHSLRLHWVEFQNKFYKGDGYKYEPVQFRKYIALMKQESAK